MANDKRVALVTGAAQGIGRKIALELGSRGYVVALNDLQPAELCFAYFTTTLDLDAEFPALAARRMGWIGVPLLCGNDMVVSGPNPRSVPMCIRILLLYNTDRAQSEMKSAYLRGAQAIRADLDRTAGELNIQ